MSKLYPGTFTWIYIGKVNYHNMHIYERVSEAWPIQKPPSLIITVAYNLSHLKAAILTTTYK